MPSHTNTHISGNGPPDSDVIAVARNLHVFEFDARGGARWPTLHTCHAVC